MLARKDRFYYAIVGKGQLVRPLELFSHAIDQNNRVIEVGAVTFSPELRGNTYRDRGQHLLARYVFESLTIVAMSEMRCSKFSIQTSCERLGFVYEGTFRQAVVYKRDVRGIRIGSL